MKRLPTFVSLAILIAIAGLSPSQSRADVAAGTPLFTTTLPTMDTGCPTCTPAVPPAAIPPWGSTGPNAMQYVKLFCDGTLYRKVPAPATVPTPIATAVTYQAVAGDFSIGAHSCYATYRLYSNNESVPSNTVTFTIPRPTYDPKPGVLSVQ